MPGTTHSRGQSITIVDVCCYVAATHSAKTNKAMVLTFLLLSIHKNKDKGEGHNSGLEKFWSVRLKK